LTKLSLQTRKHVGKTVVVGEQVW